jgi:microcin C transport system substrate-binding protein
MNPIIQGIQRMLAGSAVVICLAAAANAEVTISHGYSPFGELKYPADFSHFDYVNPDAPQGGEFSSRQLYGVDTFDSLNTFTLKGSPAWEVGTYVFDTLMVASEDEPDAVYGLIAETIEYPEDLSYVIFNLRPEARFSDGEPLTADDVVFTFETLKSDGPPWYNSTLRKIQAVTAEGPHRVRFDLAGDVGPTFPGNFAWIEILPEHFYQDVAFDESWMTVPIGSGPYVVDEADPPRSIRFCRNPEYWAAGLPVRVGMDNFDCITHEYYSDDSVMREAFKAGEFLFIEETKAAAWQTAYDYRATEEGWVQRTHIPDLSIPTWQAIWINTRRPHLADVRVREALSLAFNWKWANETLYDNAYQRGTSPFAQTDMEAHGLPEGRELALLEPFRDQLPVEVFTEPAWLPPEGTSSPRDREALRRASDLLDAAGWIVGDDGVRRNAEGDVLAIDFPDDSSSKGRLYTPYSEVLRGLGIEVDYRRIDPAQMEEREKVFDFDMTSSAWNLSMTPDESLSVFFGSEAASTEGSRNFSGITDPVIDALIARLGEARTRADLAAAARAIDRVLRLGHYWVPLYYGSGANVAYWDVFGQPEIAPAHGRGERYWWWDDARYQALVEAGALR